MQGTKTHHQATNVTGGSRVLFCSGRSVLYAATSSRLDDVDCGTCRRRLVARSKRA